MYRSKMDLAVAVCRCSSLDVSTEFEVVENLLGQHVCTVDRFDVRSVNLDEKLYYDEKIRCPISEQIDLTQRFLTGETHEHGTSVVTHRKKFFFLDS